MRIQHAPVDFSVDLYGKSSRYRTAVLPIGIIRVMKILTGWSFVGVLQVRKCEWAEGVNADVDVDVDVNASGTECECGLCDFACGWGASGDTRKVICTIFFLKE